MENILCPKIEEIIEINKKVGSDGVLINKGNLEFALESAKHAKTLIQKATIILYDIISGHPFLDGNKRTAFVAMELFLKMNGKELDYSKGEEYLMERILYDIAEKRIKKESLENILSELVK